MPARIRHAARRTRHTFAPSVAAHVLRSPPPPRRPGRAARREHLERLGYEVVARNHRTRYGEIDLVVADARSLVIVEVKSRRGRGNPWDALDERKRRQVRRMGIAYLTSVEDRPAAPRCASTRSAWSSTPPDGWSRCTTWRRRSDAACAASARASAQSSSCW
jgi:putative endonuclease